MHAEFSPTRCELVLTPEANLDTLPCAHFLANTALPACVGAPSLPAANGNGYIHIYEDDYDREPPQLLEQRHQQRDQEQQQQQQQEQEVNENGGAMPGNSTRRSKFCLCMRRRYVLGLVLCGAILAVLLRLLGSEEGDEQEEEKEFKKGCPFGNEFVVCAWGSFSSHEGEGKGKKTLPIAPGNSLWVDLDTPAGQKGMTKLLHYLSIEPVHDVDRQVCEIFRKAMSEIGLNGLIEVVQGLEELRDQGNDEIVLRGVQFQRREPLLTLSADWGHLLGAFVIGNSAHEMVWKADGEVPSVVRDAIEVTGSLSANGAPLHAVVWASVMAIANLTESNMESVGETLWAFALRREMCGAFDGRLAGLFVHCLHGFGHGVMTVGILKAVSSEQRAFFHERYVCDGVRRGTTRFIVQPEMLRIATNICQQAQIAQHRYICAGGLFMEFWKSRQPYEQKLNAFWGTCATSVFPAPCFRFKRDEPSWEEMISKFDNRSYDRVVEPCTQGNMQSSISLTGLHYRGCIFGAAFKLYEPFDEWRHALVARSRQSNWHGLRATVGRVFGYGKSDVANSDLHTLTEWCSFYEPVEKSTSRIVPEWRSRATSPLHVRSYGNWLACIAGAMASTAFLIEDHGVDRFVVERHCKQLSDTRARKLCIDIAMSRHTTNVDDLRIWPSKVLEQANLIP